MKTSKLILATFAIALAAGCGNQPPPAASTPPTDTSKLANAEPDGDPDVAASAPTADNHGANPTGLSDGEEPNAADVSPPHRRHKPNRLAQETSPYLLMHAHNPVNWYPWGDEAFAKAVKEDKLIFLSIGYSSCYWCHVMERESFMDETIAAYLNEHFVCIKVDREERPDVDDIYMKAVLFVAGRGGWPLSAFLTPDAKPFFGGTYFPARAGDRGARLGFFELLRGIHAAWEKNPDRLRADAERLTDAVAEVLLEKAEDKAVEIEPKLVEGVVAAKRRFFDDQYGGFGRPPFQTHNPKFPSPPDLLFLIDRVRRHEDQQAREMLLLTLDKMAQGGIRDHLGGGFHRYSVDRFWHVPHFEKMLYDNGQLATVYAEAFALTGHERYRRVVVELLEFVLREMTDASGGFFSAIDAETDAQEGKFYRWERRELDAALDASAREFLGPIYSFAGEPNFRHESHEFYVLQLASPISELAAQQDSDEASLLENIAPLRKKLFDIRARRQRPLTDTKVLTSWNGLMIRGFADAGRILKDPKYTEVAIRAAEFVLDKLQTDDGRLLRTYREGTAKLNAYLDDYAFLVDALIALDQATQDPRWLDAARQLTDKQIELFWDDQAGGFFFTSSDHETLIARAKKRTDGVIPSGNGIATKNLVHLAARFPDGHYGDYAQQALRALSVGLADEAQSHNMPTIATAVAAWLANEE